MEDNKNAYSEVIEILKLVDDEKKLEALPMEMLELLKSKANPEYKPKISKDIPLDEQNLQPETYALLNWITQKYWSDEQDIVEQIDESVLMEKTENIENKINIENIKNIEDIENTKNIENIADTEITEAIRDNSNEETNKLPVLLDNLKWYEKIKIRIIELFNKIFKRKKSEEKQEGII